MFCKYCGKPVDETTMRCKICGRPVGQLEGGNGFWDLTGEKLLMPAAAPGLQYPGEHGSLLASALMAAFSYLAAAGLLLFAAAQRLRSRTV